MNREKGPQQTSSDVLYDQRLAQFISDLCDRISGGEQVELEEVCIEQPEFAADIEDLWGTIIVTQTVGREAPDIQEKPGRQSQLTPLFELPYRMGRFTLQEEIGRGGMGVVYRAVRIADNQTVAIKLMLKGDIATRVERERFEAEARAAAALNHPGIVPIYEVGEHMGRSWFSMEFIRGQTLAQVLAAGPLSGKRAARIVIQVASAVDHAHEMGVLHRDLKPSNVLIGADDHAWVCDFGLAKNSQSAAASLTKTGAVIGTPSYMAPEQAAGARGQVGPVSDVYGLGAVLYHMLTGRPPFLAATSVDTVLMVLEQDPVPPRVLNRRVDRGLEMITMRCLQKPQDLRYRTASALGQDLLAFLDERPVAASEGRFMQVIAGLFRETHHASVLQNWGLLWMWHSLVVLFASVLTNLLFWQGVTNRLVYEFMWGLGFGAWAAVFWWYRRRMGPVTFVERQVAHVWGASIIAIAVLFPFENFLEIGLMRLAPVISVVGSMAFFVKAGILSGTFYIQSAALMVTAIVMAWVPDYAMIIFGVVGWACFFFPGLKYYRQRILNSRQEE